MKLSISLLFFLGAAVNAIEMATPSSPWISGESVTETWTSQSGDPASFALVMNGNDETLLIEELVQTSLGTYTFAVPNVTGQWAIAAANIGDLHDVYASSGIFLIEN